MDFWEKIAEFLRDDVEVNSLKAQFETYKNDQISGVIKNKEKILDEKKALQAELDELKQKTADYEKHDISVDKFMEMEIELESLKQNVTNPEELKAKETMLMDRGKTLKEKELSPVIEKLTSDLEGTSKQLEEYKVKYQKYMAQNQITKVLSDLHVQYDDMWFDGFMSRAKVEYDESNDSMDINLYLQDQNTTVPLEDWKKVWPTTEHGKRMIKAPTNYGGGAGGAGNAPGKNMKETLSGMFAYKT
jgi:hypothetical protein